MFHITVEQPQTAAAEQSLNEIDIQVAALNWAVPKFPGNLSDLAARCGCLRGPVVVSEIDGDSVVLHSHTRH